MNHESTAKQDLFAQTAAQLQQQGFGLERQDQTRPWGGFFVIDETHAQQFADTYFDGLSVDSLRISGKLSPKILIVAPGQRLSWQYHNRRSEIWRVLQGTVGIVRSSSDVEGPVELFSTGHFITLPRGERHRLVGLEESALIAEIWQHTDPSYPSDEQDIVRVQDDYGRE